LDEKRGGGDVETTNITETVDITCIGCGAFLYSLVGEGIKSKIQKGARCNTCTYYGNRDGTLAREDIDEKKGKT